MHAYEWPCCMLYAFPPFPLLWETVYRNIPVQTQGTLSGTLMASQAMVSSFLNLLPDQPWQLIIRRDLLSQLSLQIWHLDLDLDLDLLFTLHKY